MNHFEIMDHRRIANKFDEYWELPYVAQYLENFEWLDHKKIADKLIEEFEKEEYNELFLNVPISIHVDAGNSDKGKTKPLIPELVGWVKACGYDYEVKPNSFAASSIADKISK